MEDIKAIFKLMTDNVMATVAIKKNLYQVEFIFILYSYVSALKST